MGSENPNVPCDNCGKDIPRAKMTLHLVRCAKNVKKCQMCGDPFELVQLDEHIAKAKGDFESILHAI